MKAPWSSVQSGVGLGYGDPWKARMAESNVGSGLETDCGGFTGVVERCLYLTLEKEGSFKGVFTLSNYNSGSKLWFVFKNMEW